MDIGVMTFRGEILPGPLAELAVQAENLGFHSIWLPEHIVIPVSYGSKYPYGSTEMSFESEYMEAAVGCAYLAAVTSRIKLGTCVIPLFNRDPLSLAKQAAMLDALSSGRFELGIGAGWLQEEGVALGHPCDRPWGRMKELIDILRMAWSEPFVEYHGRFYDIEPVGVRPFPQQRGLPIWIGGHGPSGIRTTAEQADGNILGPDLGGEKVRELRAALPGDKRIAAIVVADSEDPVRDARELRDAGADLLIVLLNGDLQVATKQLEWVERHIFPMAA